MANVELPICKRNLFEPKSIKKYFNDETGCDKRDQNEFIDQTFVQMFNENEESFKNFRTDFLGGFYPKAYDLFQSNIDVEDIHQGLVGDCYFLSAVASLASTYPQHISNKFKSHKVPKNGCYEIALFIEGEWNIVVIDDKIALRNYHGEYITAFAKTKTDNVWAILLEKAWAKVNGGYDKIHSGIVSEALTAISGLPTKLIKFRSLDEKNKEKELWELLSSYTQQGNLMCVSTYSIVENSKIKERGLAELHGYTLLSIIEFNNENDPSNPIKLIKLRNPWGYQEWNGAWSDSDEDSWTKERLEKYKDKKDNDGIFWIELSYFLQFFQNLTVSTFHSNLNIKYLKFSVNDTIDTSPRYYRINVKAKGNLGLSAIVMDKRFHPEITEASPTQLHTVLAKVNKNQFSYLEGSYSNDKESTIIRDVEKGTYVFVVWYVAQFSATALKTNTVHIAVSSNTEFAISEVELDENLSLLTSVITPYFKSKEHIPLQNEILESNDFKFYLTRGSEIPIIIIEKSAVSSIEKEICFNIGVKSVDTLYCAILGEDEVNVIPLSIKVSGSFPTIKIVENIHYQKYQPAEDHFDLFKPENIGKVNYSNNYYSYTTGCISIDLNKKYQKELELLAKLSNSQDTSYSELITDDFVYIGQLNKHSKPHGIGFQRSTRMLEGQASQYEAYLGEFKDGNKDGQGSNIIFSPASGLIRVEYSGSFAHGKNTQDQGKAIKFIKSKDDGFLINSKVMQKMRPKLVLENI